MWAMNINELIMNHWSMNINFSVYMVPAQYYRSTTLYSKVYCTLYSWPWVHVIYMYDYYIIYVYTYMYNVVSQSVSHTGGQMYNTQYWCI